MKEAIAALLFIVFLAASLVAWFSAPCELWSYSKAGEVPARCVIR